jgi:hypothetical protein
VKQITEEHDRQIIDEWYERARKQTPDTINLFIRELAMDYQHDYGTICHAIAAAGIGAMWAVEHGPQGGITGFQAGAIQWEIIKHWGAIGTKDAPMRFVDYDHMVYPQYATQFEKRINKNTWEYLQKKARALLDQDQQGHADWGVRDHWQSIVDGRVPFGYSVEEGEDNG